MLKGHEIRSGYTRLEKRKQPVKKRAACNPYVYPSSAAAIPAYQTVSLQWDPSASCISSYDNLDIYLQSLDAAAAIHIWQSVPRSSGSLSTSFVPAWWNSTSSAQLQLIIVGRGQPVWSAPAGTGPSFTATFNGTVPSTATSAATAASATYTGPSVEVVSNSSSGSGGVTGGKLVAAVLVPLLVTAACICGYILWTRKKQGSDSKRWSQYVDQRMSTISGAQWEQGGSARPSMAHSRKDSHTSGARPGSMAGVGSAGIQRPDMAQVRPSFTSSNRVSRISFADAVPPNRSSHRLAGPSFSGSNHSLPQSTSASNLSARRYGGDPDDLAVSPDQAAGPRPFAGPATHLNRPSLSGRSASNLRHELNDDPDTAGAVSVIFSDSHDPGHAGSAEAGTYPPSPSTPSTHGPVAWPSVSPAVATTPEDSALAAGAASGMRRLSKVRTSTLSPDEALRAYTMARAHSFNHPVPTPTGSESSSAKDVRFGGMRALYTPSSDPGRAAGERSTSDVSEQRQALASVYTEGSRYSVASGPEADAPPTPDAAGFAR